MKAVLICPCDRPAVPQLAEFGPLATIPVFGDSIVNHWIEHLAALGARQIDVIAGTGADRVRAAVGDGARWGIGVDVLASRVEPTRVEASRQRQTRGAVAWLPAPNDIVLMSCLPGCPNLPLFESHASWFAALSAWMPRALTPTRVRMAQASPGIWIGSRARVSATATLAAPCWIGDQAVVGDGAVVGPGAILDDRSVVEAGARVTQSWVGPDTFVGSMTSVANSLAWGPTLTNWQTDSVLRVPDPFLLSSLANPQAQSASERAFESQGQRVPVGFFAALRARVARGIEPKPAQSGGG
jgi:hypothetical protein